MCETSLYRTNSFTIVIFRHWSSLSYIGYDKNQSTRVSLSLWLSSISTFPPANFRILKSSTSPRFHSFLHVCAPFGISLVCAPALLSLSLYYFTLWKAFRNDSGFPVAVVVLRPYSTARLRLDAGECLACVKCISLFIYSSLSADALRYPVYTHVWQCYCRYRSLLKFFEREIRLKIKVDSLVKNGNLEVYSIVRCKFGNAWNEKLEVLII